MFLMSMLSAVGAVEYVVFQSPPKMVGYALS
jgi:hypothetical protein